MIQREYGSAPSPVGLVTSKNWTLSRSRSSSSTEPTRSQGLWCDGRRRNSTRRVCVCNPQKRLLRAKEVPRRGDCGSPESGILPLAHAGQTYRQISPPEFSSLIPIQHSREGGGRFLGALISCDKAHFLGRVRNRRFFVVVE